VRYDLLRQDEQISLSITMGSYLENLPLLGSYLGVLFLSVGLWAIGLVLALFAKPDDVRARLLSSGLPDRRPDRRGGRCERLEQLLGSQYHPKILLAMLAPVIVTAHLTFPAPSFLRYRKGIISLVLAASLLLSTMACGKSCCSSSWQPGSQRC
jgi:hypothetical protein